MEGCNNPMATYTMICVAKGETRSYSTQKKALPPSEQVVSKCALESDKLKVS